MILKLERTITDSNYSVADPLTKKRINKFPGCKDVFTPGIHALSKQLHTGLNHEEEKTFEKKLGLEEGSLRPHSKWWESFKILIPDEGLELNDEYPLDELKIKVLKADSTIAENKKKAEMTPGVKYTLSTGEEEADFNNTRRRVLTKAYVKYDSLLDEEIKDILSLMGQSTKHVTASQLKNTLGDLIERNPSGFLNIIEDPAYKDKIFISQLVKAEILITHGSGIGLDVPLYYGDLLLGTRLSETIAFLKDKENSHIAVELKKKHSVYMKKK